MITQIRYVTLTARPRDTATETAPPSPAHALEAPRPDPAPARGRQLAARLALALIGGIAALLALSTTAQSDPEVAAAIEDEEEPGELAIDPEPAATRGAPAPSVNTSTPTPNGLRFGMELKVGLFTRPVKIDASSTNGGKIAVISVGRWKAAAGAEKSYKLTLERLDGTRWVPVGRSRIVPVGAAKVRAEWPVHGRAEYRVTVTVRGKNATGPALRVEGEVKTIVYR